MLIEIIKNLHLTNLRYYYEFNSFVYPSVIHSSLMRALCRFTNGVEGKGLNKVDFTISNFLTQKHLKESLETLTPTLLSKTLLLIRKSVLS